MEKGFEVRKLPGNISPAVWSPAMATPKSSKPNPIYVGMNGTPTSVLRSTPSTPGPSWTQQSPIPGGANQHSASPASPKESATVFPWAPDQNISPLDHDYVSSPNKATPPPPPGAEAISTWLEKQMPVKRDSGVSMPQKNVPSSVESDDIQYSNLPPQLYGTLKKDKKPFTYTPGGIDLSEIKSTRMAKRIMANQKNPGVPPRPKAMGGPSSPSIQSEKRGAIRQPVLPVIVNQQPVLTPLSNLSYPANLRFNPQSQKLPKPFYNAPNLGSTPIIALDANTSQTGDSIRQLEGLNLANNEQDPRHYNPPEQYPRSLPRNHGVRYDSDSQNPGNFRQSRSFWVLQKLTSTDDSDAQEEEPPPKKHEEDEMTFSGLKRSKIPSRMFQNLQRMTDTADERATATANVYHDNPEHFEKTAIEPRYKGGNVSQHSLKVLQEITGTSEGGGRSPPPLALQSNVRTAKPHTHLVESQRPLVSSKQFPQPEVPASELPGEPEPRKYIGGNIPSRSFRLLQTLTGEDPSTPGYQGTDF